MTKKMRSITAVRHGESDANIRGIISDKDVDHLLTEKGMKMQQIY